ncbi:SDR family NAD(P)-dependent oxidoreductase [Alcaligenes sp. A-TC2]|uniref:type I polyketide synthase n=1 Tax=Alcaligenes nematophilus TaxID=2994643 RepID=UPI00225A5A8E|nr:SDR family NAD(P)-dependent oxidoreductase [Alcaligenes nematophilus]
MSQNTGKGAKELEASRTDINKSNTASGAIAIIGMAFRFPGDLSQPDQFWNALIEKRDLVTEIPADRWATAELQHDKRSEPGRSITFSAGVLSRIDEFDADFFGISPREAAWLDPQQRLLLELSWEAMENAGVLPSSMAGSDCAVYVGISGLDYGMRGLDDLASLTAHMMTGNTMSIAANRLSYIYDLHGPSMAVDTACSSSLVALHQACSSLRNGEASTALVGGVNLLLHPYPFVGFTKASMLSADGRCKAFDEAGNGYVRSEGGAVLMLKPLEQALADGDQVQAVILATGVNADGARKTGITIPSCQGQIELMRSVLERSGLTAADVDFVEAHGTGTAVGDPVETTAISAVYGKSREQRLPIGSVKANLGHMESASGMAGLVKTVLALQHQALPPALHLNTPNPAIDFDGLNLELLPQGRELQRTDGKPLVAGLNSFGFGGANAHVLLQAPVATTAQSATVPNSGLPPLVLSAKTEAALREHAGNYADLLDGKTAQDFYDVSYAVTHRRQTLARCLIIQPETVEEGVAQLRAYAQGGQAPQGLQTVDAPSKEGQLAFVYAGNGAQWLGMGVTLLRESPRFAALLSELDAMMKPLAGFSLLEQLQAEPAASRMDDTTVAQPLLFAVQVIVTRMLREDGIEPDAVAGHSVGEIAAAWAAGALDLEQAIRVICARSQAQGLTRGQGRMAVIGLSHEAVNTLLEGLGADLGVNVAGVNSPSNITLSGSLEGLQRIQSALEGQSVFFRLLDLDYAFHSPYMDGLLPHLEKSLGDLQPGQQAPQARFISTVTGEELSPQELGVDYWWRNIREPVQFEQAIACLANQGCRVFLEIGPHAILQRYIRETLAQCEVQGVVLSSLRKHDDGPQRLTDTALHTLALLPTQLKARFPVAGNPVELPVYPWQRERHWYKNSTEGMRSIERRRVHDLLGWRLPDSDLSWENVLDPVILPWLADHKVGGAMVYPGAAYLEMALAAAREWLGEALILVDELDILAPLVFDGEHARSLRFVLSPRDGSFHIKSRQRLSQDEWVVHASGRILASDERMPVAELSPLASAELQIDRDRHYRLAHSLGLDYGPAFQGLKSSQVQGTYLSAELEMPVSLEQDGYLLHPALMDVCYQSLVDFFAQDIEAGQGVALLPVKVGRFTLSTEGQVTHFRAHLRRSSARSVLADFELYGADGRLLASAQACRFRAAYFLRQDRHAVSNWQITPYLRPHPRDERVAVTLSPEQLAQSGWAALADQQQERETWFQQTLPLLDALSLSFIYEAFQNVKPSELSTEVLNSPYGRWLSELLRAEELLQDDEGYRVVEQADMPAAQDLWRTILQDSPSSLPQLTQIGSVGRQLPALLRGDISGEKLLASLRRSPVVEVLYDDDPMYLGVRLALETQLRELAANLPASQRLRVLEVAVGPSDLPKTLAACLSEDQFEYVLALPDADLQARQATQHHTLANVQVLGFDLQDWQLEQVDKPQFDVVILRHSLHRTVHVPPALMRSKQWLATGGVLLVAECHPDWHADFLSGLDQSWWHAAGESQSSSLLSPEGWHKALEQAGFEQVQTAQEPAAQELSEGVYLLLAKAATTQAIPNQEAVAPAKWVLLFDEASQVQAHSLQARLEAAGQTVNAQIWPLSADILADESPLNVVQMLGWADTAAAVSQTSAQLLSLTQDLSARTVASRLFLVTQGGALPAMAEELDWAVNPAQSALWGFGRVVMNELPALSCTLIDLAGDVNASDIAQRLELELLWPDEATEIVLSQDARHTLVLEEATAAATAQLSQDARFKLDFQVPGQLRNLEWQAVQAPSLAADQVEVRTMAAGLNFRDVMYLMGLLPDEAVENGFAGASLGLEFSGVVTRVGADVTNLTVGQPVMGFGSSCFASHVVTRADAIAPMPEGWDFEAAATVPTVFFTVYYALTHLAHIQPGEKVLIHGAAGGVGIAAIQLARHLGAEIYATAGTDEKRVFASLLGADHVFDSRSLSFAQDVMDATGGEGVDVVLNSLAGEAMRRSLDVLSPFGRFLELGKRDFFENTPIGLRPFKSNISYFGIDADQLLTGRPALAGRLFKEVMELFHDGALFPLPYRSFGAEHVVDAFRAMQQARHIGKLVVSLKDAQPRLPAKQIAAPLDLSEQGTWLVTGGLSGFGLASAQWLVKRGVRSLVLAGRRGADTPGAQELLKQFQAQGCRVQIVACDVTDSAAVQAVVAQIQTGYSPLTGVLHAAAVFDDRLIANMDQDSLNKVLQTKLVGAWNLHLATQDLKLSHFVLYSSVTTSIGNPGQANYVAANAGLEGLTRLRQNLGLAASCIAWGPIGDAGYLTRNETVKDSLGKRLGKAPLQSDQALDQLDRVLAVNGEVSIVANFDWNALARLLASAQSERFAILNRARKDHDSGSDGQDIHTLIAGKTPEQIHALVAEWVAQEVANILRTEVDRIETQRSLHDLGMDSLMAVELALGLEQRFGVQLPAMVLNDSPTVWNVAARIVDKLTAGGEDSAEQDAGHLVADVVRQHGDDMSEADLQGLAKDVQRLAETGTSLINE